MRDLAAKVGVSDVGLKKLLRAAGVVTPPQGHWNRVLAGKKVLAPPKAAPRKPGGTGRVSLDRRFRGLVPEAGPMPEAGPFESAAVPEDLDILRNEEAKRISRIGVARTWDRPHAALAPLLKREEQRRQKQATTGWAWDGPQWSGALAQRQLRIVDALFGRFPNATIPAGCAYRTDSSIYLAGSAPPRWDWDFAFPGSAGSSDSAWPAICPPARACALR